MQEGKEFRLSLAIRKFKASLRYMKPFVKKQIRVGYDGTHL